MSAIRKPRAGERPSAETISQLVDAVNQFDRLRVAAPLTMRKSAAGVAIGCTGCGGGTGQVTPEKTGGTTKELAHVQATQDTDDWTRATDDCPVEVQLITDIQYSTSTHKLTFRTRTLAFGRGGRLESVSAEGDLVEITTAEEC